MKHLFKKLWCFVCGLCPSGCEIHKNDDNALEIYFELYFNMRKEPKSIVRLISNCKDIISFVYGATNKANKLI
jgi:hypothetical protein